MIKRAAYTILMLLTSCLISAQSIASHPQLKVISSILKELDYEWLISEEDFKTMIIVPLGEEYFSYVNPTSYVGGTINSLWEVNYGKQRASEKNDYLYARVYDYVFNESSSAWEKVDNEYPKTLTLTSTSSGTLMKTGLEGLLKNIIIKGDYEEGKLYYNTIGNTVVRIDGIEKGSNIYGPLQMENDTPLQVVETFVDGGCRVLVVDAPIMGARKSVSMLLSEKPELSKFAEIVSACCSYNDSPEEKLTAISSEGGNLLYYYPKNKYQLGYRQGYRHLLNNFHYTLYAPTNAAMEKAFAKGLPTIEDLRAAEEYDVKTTGEVGDSTIKIKTVMVDFVRYHLQDFSLPVDKGVKGGKYNTAKNILNYISDSDYYTAFRPYRLNVDVTESSLRVTDALGNTYNVVTNAGLHNMVANEYWMNKSNIIKKTSTVVIHAIDGPLMYSDDQFIYKFRYIK